MYDKQNQLILTFKKLEQENCGHFCLKNSEKKKFFCVSTNR